MTIEVNANFLGKLGVNLIFQANMEMVYLIILFMKLTTYFEFMLVCMLNQFYLESQL